MVSALCDVRHSVIMADFLMPETQQSIIVIILIINSYLLLKVGIELQEYNSAAGIATHSQAA